MHADTRTLLDALTEGVLAQINQEIRLGKILQQASDGERTEIAYYIEDSFQMHPDRPPHAHMTLAKVEAYINYHLRRTDWQLAWDDLLDEGAEIDELAHELFDEDVTLYDEGDVRG